MAAARTWPMPQRSTEPAWSCGQQAPAHDALLAPPTTCSPRGSIRVATLPPRTDTHKFEARYRDGLVGPWPEADERLRARSPSTTPIAPANRIHLPGPDDRVVPADRHEILVDALRTGAGHAPPTCRARARATASAGREIPPGGRGRAVVYGLGWA